MLLGVVGAEDAELAGPLEHPVGEQLVALPLVGVGRELLLGERADRLAEPLVLFAEALGHGAGYTAAVADTAW